MTRLHARTAQVITARASTEFVRSPGLPQLELRRSAQDRTCYRPHTHERFSVGIIDSGSTQFSSAVGDPVRLVPRDVILIPAGFVHACNPDSGRWEYRMIHADEAWLAALAPDTAEHLVSGIRVVRHAPAVLRFAEVSVLLSEKADPDRVASAFRAGLDECVRVRPAHLFAPDDHSELLAVLQPVLEKLGEEEANPALDELAALAGMDRYQLIRAMKRTTGFSPLAWRQNDRVIRGREMLRAGTSVVDTAIALGFVDQSHFHRVFRAHVAAPPGAYRG